MPLKKWESYCFNITETELNASLISDNRNNKNENETEIVTLFIGILIGFIVGIIPVFVMLWYQRCGKGRVSKHGYTRHGMELTAMSSTDDIVVHDRMTLVAQTDESNNDGL